MEGTRGKLESGWKEEAIFLGSCSGLGCSSCVVLYPPGALTSTEVSPFWSHLSSSFYWGPGSHYQSQFSDNGSNISWFFRPWQWFFCAHHMGASLGGHSTLQLMAWWSPCIRHFCWTFLECFPFSSLNPNVYIRFKRMYWPLYGKSAVTSKIQIWVNSTIQNITLRGKIWKKELKILSGEMIGFQNNEAHLLDFCIVTWN